VAEHPWLSAGWEQQPRDQEMLFDLYFDPDQMYNLVGQAKLKDVESELRKSLEKWMEDTEDTVLSGSVPLPAGAFSTDPDAFSPEDEPFIMGA
jgi:hypothetical protein